MGGEGPALGGNAGGTEATDKGRGEIAHGGKDVGTIAGAQAGAIFADGDITDVVTALDSLIAPDKRADAGHGGRWA